MRLTHLLALLAIFLLSNCSPYRIYKSYDMFKHVDEMYPFSGKGALVVARDSVYVLANTKVRNNGELSGEIVATKKGKVNERETNGQKAIIYLNKRSAVRKDSTKVSGASQRLVTINESDVNKVVMKNVVQNGVKYPVYAVYNRRWSNGIFFLVLMIVVTIGLIVASGIWVSDNLGCFIATMVYGHYNASEVLVLRRFRDECLIPYFAGRVFVNLYYAISPYMVKVFRNNRFINACFKSMLDPLVAVIAKKQNKADLKRTGAMAG